MSVEIQAEVPRTEACNANIAIMHIVNVLTAFALAFASCENDISVEVARNGVRLIATVSCHPDDIGRMRGAKRRRIELMTTVAREIATRYCMCLQGVRIYGGKAGKSAVFANLPTMLNTLEVVEIPGKRRRFIRPS